MTDADEFRWENLDERLLSPKLHEVSEEMQKRSVEGERKAAFDTHQSGNAAGYLTRLFDFQERLTDEWAERLYAAHCEAWSQQNRTVTPAFIRAVRDRACQTNRRATEPRRSRRMESPHGPARSALEPKTRS